MAAGGACSNAVDGYSVDVVDVAGVAPPFRLDSTDRVVSAAAAAAAATTGSCRGSFLNPASCSTLRGFSVMIVCFLSVFSFFGSDSRIARSRARCACHSDHRSDRLETKRKRGFKNDTAPAKENVVERNSDTRNAD